MAYRRPERSSLGGGERGGAGRPSAAGLASGRAMLVNDGPDDDDDRGDGVAGQDPQVAADVVGAEVDDAAHGVSRGAVGQGRADGPPERRARRGLVGAARAGVAEDDEEQDRDADAYDAEQGLEGQGDGADREDQQGAEPPQGYQVAGERAEDRADHDGAGQNGDDRVRAEGDQPVEGAAGGGGPGAGGDAEQRGDEVAADAPPDDEVEAGQAAVVTGLHRHDVGHRHRAVLAGLDRGDDLLGRAGLRASGGGGDEQGVGFGGRVDHQRGADGVVADQAAGGRLARGRGRVQRCRRDEVELGHNRAGLRGRRDDGERDSVRRGRMERPHVGQDEPDLQQQHPDDQADRTDGNRIPELAQETLRLARRGRRTGAARSGTARLLRRSGPGD